MREHVHDLGAALADEFAAIHGPTPSVTNEAEFRARAAAIEQSALCLSGGGIRSAAFCMGVVQALARARLLTQFHYLSTVSGGGFTGAWLSALIREKGSAHVVEAELRENEAAPALQALREYTDYLTPMGGLLSADTWTAIVLYLRNLMINWLAFAPIFLLAVLATIFYRTVLWWAGDYRSAYLFALAIGVACVVVATFFGCRDLPSHRPLHGLRRFVSYRQVWIRIVLPLLVWAALAPGTISGWLEHREQNQVLLVPEFTLPCLYAAALTLGYWAAAIGGRATRLYWSNFGSWLIATACSAFLIWLGLQGANLLTQPDQAEALAVIGPLWLTLANVLQVTIHVALRPETMLGDLDREWLARLSAIKLRLAVAWTLFAFCCLSLQRLAFPDTMAGFPFWAVPLATFAAGPLAAWLGRQAQSQAEAAIATPGAIDKFLAWALPVLGTAFTAGLFTVLGFLVGRALGFVQTGLAMRLVDWSMTYPKLGMLVQKTDHMTVPMPLVVPGVTLLVQIAAVVVLTTIMLVLVKRINVNRFSMHGVYRNRLTRAFLGAVRANRTPDPFTGFDPQDNPRMVELLPRTGPGRLFHVVNVALNLTATTRTAWAERKAAAFTITPLACGSADLWLPKTSPKQPTGCFVPSADYAGSESETGRAHEPKGISLASAMTISGAAVSPSWGYHSSPITAFLMTLFNVRLGAWLPNPSVVTDRRELALAWPHRSLLPMLDDLLGRTTDTTKAIYLSDGGHFDNLGLYEMLRRRCRLILVVDAGEDFDCDFEDLGNAIRKAAIDQQIHVTFSERIRIAARGSTGSDPIAFAAATIAYPEGQAGGTLLYIKPSYLDDIPADVRAYGAGHVKFPHEPTTDQWFTESQFESYRALGEHQMSALCALMTGEKLLADLFAAAQTALEPVAPPAYVT